MLFKSTHFFVNTIGSKLSVMAIEIPHLYPENDLQPGPPKVGKLVKYIYMYIYIYACDRLW